METVMLRIVRLLAAVLLLVGSPRVEAAAPRACKQLASGFGAVVVEENGGSWTYAATVSGAQWATEGMGHHLGGLLECASCPAWGLYYLLSNQVENPPKTAAERGRRRLEHVGYPPVRWGAEDLEHDSSREG